MGFQSINPTTGERLRDYQGHALSDAVRALERAHMAFEGWRKNAFSVRSAVFLKAAELLLKNKDSYASMMSAEMGKPVLQARAEVDKCAWACRYFAEHAEALLRPVPVSTQAPKSYVSFEALGVVLAIMPWNFPFWQLFRALVPTLMAGNAVLIKPAEITAGCALAIQDLLAEAGLPAGLCHTLFLSHKTIAALIAHPLVQAVTFTGSVEAGRRIAAIAGAALKKTVLELGGSDPLLVLADADLEHAVRMACQSRFVNSGQSCIAAKRFIVIDSIRDAFETRLLEAIARMKMGDPLDENNDIGPLARRDLRTALHRQVRQSIKQGARCRIGGKIPKGKGSFYPPTLLSAVKKGMPAYHEEIFGPVAVVIAAKDEADAIRIANDTRFGLGATVLSRDLKRAEQIARQDINAGFCAVNDIVKSDPRLPFGGIKDSGYGRELSVFGIREFVNIKTIVVS